MSMNKIFITTAIAALGVASVSTAASAQNSRYGGNADVHAYEGVDCNYNPCGPVAQAPKRVQSSRYGGEYAEQAPAYANCHQMNACGPQMMSQPTTVYTQPQQPMYVQQQYMQQPAMPMYEQQTQMYAQAPANCPAGTTGQPDGTCLQTGSTSTYSSTTTYGSSSSSSDYSSGYDVVIDTAPTMTAPPVNCPAGTTAQPDGTCLQGSTYGSSTSTYSSTTTYTGDATSSTENTTPSYGYTSDGAYTASDYLPVRK